MARLKLHVTPGAREDRIAGWQGDSLRVRVRARPEKGLANEAALRLLAGRLNLPRSRLDLVRGATSRDKLIEVEGLSEDELRARLGRTPQ
ncbi:MAG: DUF167 domain-containing protein [Dehalococcoidia bacterium]|nr:DUF167 domain-containing protein [Dehalococcoidia bacterium]